MEGNNQIATTEIQDKTTIEFNPFPGLRPFGIEESHLFFGREGQSEEVLSYLAKNRFVAVVGASGSGKSSLMYCGLVPILYGGFVTQAGSKWKIVTMRPGNNPINNLADSLVSSESNNDIPEEDILINKNVTRTILRTSSIGLIEAVKMLKKPDDENILLMVDQFEELFRYKESRKDSDTFNESESFVKLLVEAAKQKEAPIYIILTMRSDFIGDCSQFQELTELINLSNYLIPQMTRDDFKNAIQGPVAVGGGKIDPNLVQNLLNDIGDNPDQLPILQHALMRTWENWTNIGDTSVPISIENYEAIGKMEKALSEHANEAFDELSPAQKEYCSAMFKALTERGSDNRGIRHPSRLDELTNIAEADIEELKSIIDTFRKAGRSFLTPSWEVKLNENSVVDISHESLMRVWARLKIWVDEEANSVQMYSRLSEAAQMFQEGKTSLWRPPDLHLAISWRNSQKPTLAWAQRYNPAFERTLVFLDTSEKEFKAEEQNKIKLQKRALQRTRMFALVLGSAAILSLGFLVFSIMQTVEAKKAREEAVAQKEEADKQREEADKQREIAIEEEKKAKEQEQLAKEQKEIAQEQEQLAKEQKEIAVEQEQIANVKTIEATKEKENAFEQQKIAEEQRIKAEEASTEAYRLRMVSIGQAMAVKSDQIKDDIELKALLASHAKILNEKYKGKAHHADIFKGLYEALKYKKGIGYNIYKGHTGQIKSIKFSPVSNKFYSADGEGKILEWNISSISDSVKNSIQLIDNPIPNRMIDISKDGKWLACGPGNRDIQLFNLTNNDSTLLKGHTKTVTFLVFSKQKNILYSVSNDLNIFKWDLSTSSPKPESIHQINTRAKSFALSPNGNILAIGKDNGELDLIYLMEENKVENIIKLDDNQILSAAFDQNNEWLAFGDKNGVIRVRELKTKKIISEFKAHNNRISDIKFSPDNKILATASFDGTIRLWEKEDLNNQPYILDDHESFVMTIDFSNDGQYLLSGGNDNQIIAWPIVIDKLTDDLNKTITRNFTKDEWNTYVAKDIDYEKTIENLE
ncbi:hypothetical protein ACFLTE_08855 [Bacteroidota bacterium]